MKRSISFWITVCCLLHLQAQFMPVKVNMRNNSPNEVSIAIDPTNPQRMVAAANLTNIYHSRNGGITWIERNFKSSLGAYGDPVVMADSRGNFYLAHLALSKYIDKSKGFYSALDRIVIQKSTDGGETWSDGTFCGYNQGKMQDKPWLSTDATGTVYVTWTEFDQYESKNPEHHSRIRFSKSTDGGLTFSPAITISDSSGNCLDGDDTPEGATTAVGKSGEIYAAWAAFGRIYLDVSRDGGLTWGRDSVVTQQRGGWAQQIPGFFRCNGMPFLKSDAAGQLYLLFAHEFTPGSLHCDFSGPAVCLLKAQGNGNWTEVLHQPGVMPNLCIDPSTGHWYVHCYKPHRQIKTGMAISHFYTTVLYSSAYENQQPRQVSAVFALPPRRVFFGDYIDVAAAAGHIRPVWMQPDTNQMACYTALPAPGLSVLPTIAAPAPAWGSICTGNSGLVVLLSDEQRLGYRHQRFAITDAAGNSIKTGKRKFLEQEYGYYSVSLKVRGLKPGVLYYLKPLAGIDVDLPPLPFRVWPKGVAEKD